jgi:hypothetical protein
MVSPFSFWHFSSAPYREEIQLDDENVITRVPGPASPSRNIKNGFRAERLITGMVIQYQVFLGTSFQSVY